jgi:hypothetical protein
VPTRDVDHDSPQSRATHFSCDAFMAAMITGRSCKAWRVRGSSEDSPCATLFASASTTSLPSMSLWPGIHAMWRLLAVLNTLRFFLIYCGSRTKHFGNTFKEDKSLCFNAGESNTETSRFGASFSSLNTRGIFLFNCAPKSPPLGSPFVLC